MGQTDLDDLSASLLIVAKRKITAEELRQQRVSYILSTTGNDSDITEVQVESVLDEADSKTKAVQFG